jgi:hypothetical protein
LGFFLSVIVLMWGGLDRKKFNLARRDLLPYLTRPVSFPAFGETDEQGAKAVLR